MSRLVLTIKKGDVNDINFNLPVLYYCDVSLVGMYSHICIHLLPCIVIAPKFDEFSDKYPDAVFLKVSFTSRCDTHTIVWKNE